jgi:hypothetical protein
MFFLVIALAMVWRLAGRIVGSAYRRASLLLNKSPQPG